MKSSGSTVAMKDEREREELLKDGPRIVVVVHAARPVRLCAA